MALSSSSMVLRRLGLTNKGLSHFRPRSLPSLSAASIRSFNTNSQMARVAHPHPHPNPDEGDVSRRQRGGSTAFLSDVFDPFTPTRSVSQLMNLMDQLVENSTPMGLGLGLGGGGVRRGWDIREDEDALHIKVDMPGLGKEDVNISVDDNNTLIIKGQVAETENQDEHQWERRRYSSRIDLTPNLYKIDAIQAHMKNGVLKLTVPKLKFQDRKDVFHVQVN